MDHMQKSSRLLQAWLSSSRRVLDELQQQRRILEAEEKKLKNEMACGEALKQEVVAPLQEFVREQFQEGSRRGECGERCLVWFFSLFRASSCLILSQQVLFCQHFFGGCQAAIASLREVLVARAQQVSSRAREERERVRRKLAGARFRACFLPVISFSEHEISVLCVQPACTSFRRLSAVTFPASRLHCASSRRKSTLQRRLWTSRHALFLFPPLPPLLISDSPQDLDKARERMREISAGMNRAQELMRELVGLSPLVVISEFNILS